MGELSHLGGHSFRTWIDEGVLKWFKAMFFSHFDYPIMMVDVGCGPGGMSDLAAKYGFWWCGIDGDPDVTKRPLIVQHDFTEKTYVDDLVGDFRFDLGWSVEFLEHVEEQYIPNYMQVFRRCDYVICTAAPPGWGGHHHVNEQPQEYWIEKFDESGFDFDGDLTQEMKKHSTMKKHSRGISFMQNTGMFFEKRSRV